MSHERNREKGNIDPTAPGAGTSHVGNPVDPGSSGDLPPDATENHEDVPASDKAPPHDDLSVPTEIEDAMPRDGGTGADLAEPAAAIDGIGTTETTGAVEPLGASPILEPTAGNDVSLADMAAGPIAPNVDQSNTLPPDERTGIDQSPLGIDDLFFRHETPLGIAHGPDEGTYSPRSLGWCPIRATLGNSSVESPQCPWVAIAGSGW